MNDTDLNLDDAHVVDVLRYFTCKTTMRRKAEVVISDGNITVIDPSVDIADLTVVAA